MPSIRRSGIQRAVRSTTLALPGNLQARVWTPTHRSRRSVRPIGANVIWVADLHTGVYRSAGRGQQVGGCKSRPMHPGPSRHWRFRPTANALCRNRRRGRVPAGDQSPSANCRKEVMSTQAVLSTSWSSFHRPGRTGTLPAISRGAESASVHLDCACSAVLFAIRFCLESSCLAGPPPRAKRCRSGSPGRRDGHPGPVVHYEARHRVVLGASSYFWFHRAAKCIASPDMGLRHSWCSPAVAAATARAALPSPVQGRLASARGLPGASHRGRHNHAIFSSRAPQSHRHVYRL